ncbi:MAG: hypothetical protein QXW57_01725 [Candidatus Micrarchaeaceae archaeon]
MKILQNKDKTVLVASGKDTNCPRAVVSRATVKFADDYHGRIKVSKKLASMLF